MVLGKSLNLTLTNRQELWFDAKDNAFSYIANSCVIS